MQDAPLKNPERLREEILRRLPLLTLSELQELDRFIDTRLKYQADMSKASSVMAQIA